MSILAPPISTLFQGDVTIDAGLDIIDYGYGDLNVKRNVSVNGGQSSINSSTASLVLVNGGLSINNQTEAVSATYGGSITSAGGLAIKKSGFIGLNFDVDGHTTLDRVSIDTTDGNFQVRGTNSVDINVGTSSNFILTEGNLLLNATNGSICVISGSSSANAVEIYAKNPGGGINMETSSGGLTVNTRNNGAISLNAEGRSSNFTLSSLNPNHNLRLELLNETQSYFHILSETMGKRNTSDPSIIEEDALTLETTHEDGSIRLKTGNGNIFLNNDQGLNGKIEIQTGSNGFHVETGTNGPLTMKSYDSSSIQLISTMNTQQDLSFELLGEYDGKLRIYSESNLLNNAIDITATNGGVNMSANTMISIESPYIKIGTELPSNVRSGTLTVDDDFIHINEETYNDNSTGGITVKRYQKVGNGTLTGDVVENGTPMYTGQVGSNNTITTIELPTINNDISNYWIKIIPFGSGITQVRKIKSFNILTRIATIYSSLDDPNPVNPTIGLDWTSIPTSIYTFELYKCNYVYSYWDEETLTWRFSCSLDKEKSNETNINLQINDLNCRNIESNDIVSNNITTGSLVTQDLSVDSINNIDLETYISGFRTVELNDNIDNVLENEGILDLNSENKNFGLFMIFIRPEDETLNRPSAVFTVGKSAFFNYGNVVKFISVKGENNSQLDMIWKDTFPKLSYRPYPSTTGNNKTRYTIKIIKL